jgi:hypothetical protein
MASWLKKLGKVVNKVTDIGSGLVGYIPGVGPIAGGVLDAAGDLAGGKNLKSALGSGLKTGGMAFLGGKAASLLGGKLGSVGKILGAGRTPDFKPNASLMEKYGNTDALGSVIKNADGSYAGGNSAGLSGSGGWMDKLGSVIGGAGKVAGALTGSRAPGSAAAAGGGMPDWMKLLGTVGKVALPAYGAYQASKTAGKADALQEKAMKLIEAEYAAGQPLRDMGLKGMMDPRLADVSGLFNKARPDYRRIVN